jgi:alkylation response protein AidB-like acyl-CoA dehydrogenase
LRGWLIGEENGGMRAMFTMMNNARLNVGLQGVSIAERATQAAVAYASSACSRRAPAGRAATGAIIGHPDVRRMLLRMKALTQARAALTYYARPGRPRALGDARQPGAGRSADAPGQGLWHRCRRRGGEPWAPVHAAWVSSRRRRRPALSRRPHRADLRRHQRDPGGDLVGRKLGLEGGAVLAALLADIRTERRGRVR